MKLIMMVIWQEENLRIVSFILELQSLEKVVKDISVVNDESWTLMISVCIRITF